MTRECPIPGCTVDIPAHLLMCRKHWAQLSPDLRSEVYAAWNARQWVGSPETIEAHEDVKARAIKAVQGQL